jgi:tetratricopeptide (TPR) repeat protein
VPVRATDVRDAIDRCNDASRQGHTVEALRIANGALQHAPKDPRLLYARALVLFDWGRHFEARRDLLAANGMGFDTFGLHLNLGQVLAQSDPAGEAEWHLRRAVDLGPGLFHGHLALGRLLQGLQRHDDAIECFRRALDLVPDPRECLTLIAASLLDSRKPIDAEAVAREILAREPTPRPRVFGLLGMALAMQGRHAEALDAFTQGETTDVDGNDEVFANFGFNLIWMNRADEAIEVYRRHLPARPSAVSTANYGGACLTLGHLREGWPYYEFRWAHEPLLSLRPRLPIPRWNGQDVSGKTVLVWTEQGVGDLIQFVRFTKALKERGANVVLLVGEHLCEFAQAFPNVDSVVGTVTETIGHYDFHIPLLSLPLALDVDLASVSCEIPYINVDDARIASWRQRIAGDGFKVGLVWSGNPKHDRDAYRSAPVSVLGPMLEVEGMRWYSLQKDPRPADRAAMNDLPIVDVAGALGDFLDTAAAIECLDLVVTVDTAVAHLAGALGKPVWVLLPEASDFRWLRDREDSTWYPSMRLFRQARLGEWTNVVQRVKSELQEATRKGAVPAVTPSRAVTPPVQPIAGLTRLADTRWGFMQYKPDMDDEAIGLAYYGEHLQPQLDVVAHVLPADGHVVEVGAGIGGHAVALATLLELGHVWLYENDAYRRQLLAQNLAANRTLGRVTIMRGSLRTDSETRADDAPGETIDDLMLERLDMLKVARPGEARAVLIGAQATLWRSRPALYLRAVDEDDLRELADTARDFGYRSWPIATNLFSPDNFNRRNDDRFNGRRAFTLLALPEERPEQSLPPGVGKELK